MESFESHTLAKFRNAEFYDRVGALNFQFAEKTRTRFSNDSGRNKHGWEMISLHHMFGAFANEEPEGNYVRLLVLDVDDDLSFYGGRARLTFWIDRTELAMGNFENVFLYEEK